MFLLHKPSEQSIQAFLGEQARLDFTYAAVGATATEAPAGFQLDHSRFPLGSGDAVFANAKAAMRQWKQFDLGWARVYPSAAPLEPCQTVAAVFYILGLWCVFSARIVYVVDEPNRFGFAYGTLPGHAETGEERFLIERDDDGAVWYDIRAFSRPGHLLTKLGYPYVRRLQKRFVRESAAAVRREVTRTL